MSRGDPPSTALARAISGFRDAKDMTQEAVAVEAGITPGSLSRIEGATADPQWTTVEQVARALDISLVELAEAVEAERA